MQNDLRYVAEVNYRHSELARWNRTTKQHAGAQLPGESTWQTLRSALNRCRSLRRAGPQFPESLAPGLTLATDSARLWPIQMLTNGKLQ